MKGHLDDARGQRTAATRYSRTACFCKLELFPQASHPLQKIGRQCFKVRQCSRSMLSVADAARTHRVLQPEHVVKANHGVAAMALAVMQS